MSENIKSGNQNRTDDEDVTLKNISVGNKKLDFYFNIIKYPVVFAIVINVIYFFARKSFEVMWVFDILAFVYIAVLILKKKIGGKSEAFVACGLSGLFIGFFMALFKLIYYREFYLVFNLISEPSITFVVGGFIGLAIAYIIIKPNIINKDYFPKIKKGGD